ncbi:aldehyde dehydrogenase family protein, partial [Rhodococcus sp. EPR-157]|uniref:aldehyde dehydrogenase family protein n=1 Tax=Rhodococcus sp. EPR-157 TaxID=1813677 RepID=UPI000A98EDFD
EERVGRTPVAAPADIDAAATAARTAFDSGPWARTSPTERAQVLARAAKLIEARSAELTAVISDEMGAPYSMVGMLQQTPALAVLNYY